MLTYSPRLYTSIIEKSKHAETPDDEFIAEKKKALVAEVEKKHKDIQKQQMTKDKALIRVSLMLYYSLRSKSLNWAKCTINTEISPALSNSSQGTGLRTHFLDLST